MQSRRLVGVGGGGDGIAHVRHEIARHETGEYGENHLRLDFDDVLGERVHLEMGGGFKIIYLFNIKINISKTHSTQSLSARRPYSCTLLMVIIRLLND